MQRGGHGASHGISLVFSEMDGTQVNALELSGKELSTRVRKIVLPCSGFRITVTPVCDVQAAKVMMNLRRLPEGSVTADEYIRELCARITASTSDEEVIALCEELRKAVREHTQSVRGKLIRASSLPQHPIAPVEPADPEQAA